MDLFKFMAGLAYKVSSRIARAVTQRIPISEKQNQNKKICNIHSSLEENTFKLRSKVRG